MAGGDWRCSNNPALKALGLFKADAINIAVIGKINPLAQKIFDRVGYK